MTEDFDVTCRKCKTEVNLRVPADRTLKPFTCPGCGGTLIVDAAMMGCAPSPQFEAADTPKPQTETRHYTKKMRDVLTLVSDLA